jgi:FtsH-binding integral membrane protein
MPTAQWTVPSGAAVAGLLWLALAWRRESVEALAIAALHLGLVAGRVVSIVSGYDQSQTHDAAVLITVFGGFQGVVLVAVVARPDHHRRMALIAAAGLAVTGLALRWMLTVDAWTSLVWHAVLCGELAALAWRRRDRWITGLAVVIAATDLSSLVRRHLAWSGMIAAFALLGLGLWVSRRRALSNPQDHAQQQALPGGAA